MLECLVLSNRYKIQLISDRGERKGSEFTGKQAAREVGGSGPGRLENRVALWISVVRAVEQSPEGTGLETIPPAMSGRGVLFQFWKHSIGLAKLRLYT